MGIMFFPFCRPRALSEPSLFESNILTSECPLDESFFDLCAHNDIGGLALFEKQGKTNFLNHQTVKEGLHRALINDAVDVFISLMKNYSSLSTKELWNLVILYDDAKRIRRRFFLSRDFLQISQEDLRQVTLMAAKIKRFVLLHDLFTSIRSKQFCNIQLKKMVP